MAEKLFLGNEAAITTGSSASYWMATKCQSLYKGVLTKLKFYSAFPAQIKYGLYSNENAPLSLLLAQNSAQSVVGGWNEFTINEQINQNDYRWIAAVCDTANALKGSTSAPINVLEYGASTFSTHTAPDNYDGTNGTSYGMLFCAYGVEPPALVSIDGDDSILDNQTGVATVCTDAMTAQGSGKLYLSPNAIYGAGGLVEQAINSWGDTGINFDVVSTGLTPGANYAYLVTDLGQVSAALPITLVASGDPMVGKLKKIMLFESILSDNEIRSLHNRARIS